MENQQKNLQLQGHFVNVAAQLERMQRDIGELLKENQIYHNQINVLTQYMINPQSNAKIYEYLSSIVSQMESTQERLDNLEETCKKKIQGE